MRLPQVLLSLLLVSGSVIASEVVNLHEMAEKAKQGDIDAQYYLGFQYELGIEKVQDNHQAYHWYKQAAQQGDARSQYALGYLYSEGIGVGRDMEQAELWYKKSSDQHYAEAQYALANLYYSGTEEGVAMNYNLAKELYGEACDNGQRQACEEYSKLQSLGI